MNDSDPTAPTDDTPDGGTSTDPQQKRRRMDPLSLAAITSIALAVALFTTWFILSLLADDNDDAIDVRDAVEQDEGAIAGPLEVGDSAPDVTFDWLEADATAATPALDATSLSDLEGTPVVVNFWSSTCGPCLAEMPDLESVHQQVGDDVLFVGIDVTDTEDAGQQMIERTGVTYANARDPRGEIMGAFGGVALPRTVILDSAHEVVDVHTGALTEAELLDRIEANDLVQP